MANLKEVENLARAAMQQYGLVGWTFRYNSASKNRFGECNSARKTITLSPVLTLANTVERCMETVLHEIAHAIVGSRNGHNEIWKAQMIRMGLKPNRCFTWDDTVKPTEKDKAAAFAEKKLGVPIHDLMDINDL